MGRRCGVDERVPRSRLRTIPALVPGVRGHRRTSAAVRYVLRRIGGRHPLHEARPRPDSLRRRAGDEHRHGRERRTLAPILQLRGGRPSRSGCVAPLQDVVFRLLHRRRGRVPRAARRVLAGRHPLDETGYTDAAAAHFVRGTRTDGPVQRRTGARMGDTADQFRRAGRLLRHDSRRVRRLRQDVARRTGGQHGVEARHGPYGEQRLHPLVEAGTRSRARRPGPSAR